MASKKLLIMGATGKQGGAAIEALLKSKSKFQILALTRNASSPSARRLASNPRITVVEGDATSPAPIFEAHKPIYGVFCMTSMGKVPEEEQAKPVIDAALANGVEHFVFTSVDRGGPGRSEQNPTIIPHFVTKHRIEEYLKEKSAGTKMAWTILRPVAFMDNLTNDFMGKGFASMLSGLGDKPLQLIACRDIGVFAARAFADPDAYKGRAISLAGDELNFAGCKKVFRESIGYDMPETWGFIGTGIKMMSKEMGTMFNWFAEEGYGADILALRKEEPELQDFGTWLKTNSGFAEKKG